MVIRQNGALWVTGIAQHLADMDTDPPLLSSIKPDDPLLIATIPNRQASSIETALPSSRMTGTTCIDSIILDSRKSNATTSTAGSIDVGDGYPVCV